MRASLGRLVLGSLLCFILCGCEGDSASEYYGDLLSSPSGLTLEQSEHANGWGRSDCYSCHVNGNFHVPRPERRETFDMDAISELVAADGVASCASCHGNNGVSSP